MMLSPLRVYLDEDVEVLLATLLATHGLDCLTTVAAGNRGNTDEQQLRFATNESRIVITHNRDDFEDLAKVWWAQSQNHAGILIAVRRSDAYDLARHVLPILQLYDQAGWRSVVLYA